MKTIEEILDDPRWKWKSGMVIYEYNHKPCKARLLWEDDIYWHGVGMNNDNQGNQPWFRWPKDKIGVFNGVRKFFPAWDDWSTVGCLTEIALELAEDPKTFMLLSSDEGIWVCKVDDKIGRHDKPGVAVLRLIGALWGE